MKHTIQGVIFDWAGTTVDFGCFAPVSAFVEAFRKAGIDVTLEETRAPMGKLKIEHIRTMLAMPAVKARQSAGDGLRKKAMRSRFITTLSRLCSQCSIVTVN